MSSDSIITGEKRSDRERWQDREREREKESRGRERERALKRADGG